MSKTTSLRAKAQSLTAIPTEFSRIYGSLFKLGLIDIPSKFLKSLLFDSSLDDVFRAERLYDLLGDALLAFFDSLGPVYGKAGQLALTRLPTAGQTTAQRLRLNRLYGDWPAMPFEEVANILDREIPTWRSELRVDPHPLGVASMAQVHKAKDQSGREWAIKIIKPKAKKRLTQTLAAIRQGLDMIGRLVKTQASSRMLRELAELADALEKEMDLDQERDNIDRMRLKLAKKKNTILQLPETLEGFCNRNVLVIQYFRGTSLANLEHHTLPEAMRRKLARKMIHELLVQVFEIGLFHADPHAGNLILLEDGNLGLFDWGLTGELTETDRKHIAAILKALLAFDLDRLAQTLATMSRESGKEVTLGTIRSSLDDLALLLKKQQEESFAFHEMLEECLKAADRLHIVVPPGLLLMAKSLITIEGLARGIDPDISLARTATPVLFWAARPKLEDVVSITKSLPKLARKLLTRKKELLPT